MLRIINIVGAPGAGKSTLAAGLFVEMKKRYMNVELVTEYAKDLIYDGLHSDDFDQKTIFKEQHKRVARLIDNVQWVVTDSPLYLSAYYAQRAQSSDEFVKFILDTAKCYNNFNFLVKRNHRYDPNGRSQTESESDQIHLDLIEFMNSNNIPYKEIPAGDSQPLALYYHLFPI